MYIIEQLLHIEDDTVLSEIRKLVDDALHQEDGFSLPALSQEEYFRRQDEAEADARAGNVIPQQQVKAYFAKRLSSRYEGQLDVPRNDRFGNAGQLS